MELNNNTLIISGATRQITRGGNTQTISDTSWDTYIVPVLYPLWSADRDKLVRFEYSNGANETWKCDKQKYVRNHTTGVYYWKDYEFTEPDIDTVRTMVAAAREAFDAALSVVETDVNSTVNRIIEKEKGLSLTRIKIWRDFLLHTSDWTMLEDAPVTADEKADWKTWRTAIRALPDQFEAAGTNLVQTIKIPIDPKVYKINFLPYNSGVAYLSTDEQYCDFPGTPDSERKMDQAMLEYIRVAVRIKAPTTKGFNLNIPGISHMTDPVDELIKQIELEQAIVDQMKGS